MEGRTFTFISSIEKAHSKVFANATKIRCYEHDFAILVFNVSLYRLTLRDDRRI